MTTDISEKGLETIIVTDMIGGGWLAGCPSDFDREYAIDAVQLFTFLRNTQPDEWKKLNSVNFDKTDDIERKKFLARLDDELKKRGVIDLLKKRVKYHDAEFVLRYPHSSEGNEEAAALYAKNRFSVTRQLKFNENTEHSLDLGMFINGLPVITAELKNNLTKQTVYDAVAQYRGRNPTEKLFAHGRCAVHFALDEHAVQMCTHLGGMESIFYPFDKGKDGGAGNPLNPNGLSTDYLWKEILRPDSLSEIVGNYARLLQQDKQKQQIWPRYHQLDAVRLLLGRVQKEGVGGRYLVQHSAGSGKSKTIAWLAHQLADMDLQGRSEVSFNSVFVVSNRRILDEQLQRDIQSFSGDPAIAEHAEKSSDLLHLIKNDKKVIVTTVQKFPFIVDSLRNQKGKKFAIIIDEAHTGQTGKAAAKMNAALSDKEKDDVEVDANDNGEDVVNTKLEELMRNRRPLKNASYFAFTATPKAKTLELFGEPQERTESGQTHYRPHHAYWMQQAIEERFILDVLASYTPAKTALHMIKTVESDPQFDGKRAQKKLRKFVETHPKTIKEKAGVMVRHFYGCKIDRSINKQARAMVVCSSIANAVEYWHAINEHLKDMEKTDQAWVAFSGEFDHNGKKVTESGLNGFPEDQTAAQFRATENARFLVCAEKFQVGYDEKLLRVMYVDKPLSGVMAVQTLSRINRIHPQKDSCMVLDFFNNTETIKLAFQDYYQTTMLMDKADPNKLHDIESKLDRVAVYCTNDVEEIVRLFINNASRQELEPILTACRDKYNTMDEHEQVEFKGGAKTFCRFYEFIATVLPYDMPKWEKLSIFLNLLIPKLPSPKEDDLARGILEVVDMESYRVRIQAEERIQMENKEGELTHTPGVEKGGISKPEQEHLSDILKRFNRKFGKILFDSLGIPADSDELKQIFDYLEDMIIPRVMDNKEYKNSLQNTPSEAKTDCAEALEHVRLELNQEGEEILDRLFNAEGCWSEVQEWVYDRTKTKAG